MTRQLSFTASTEERNSNGSISQTVTTTRRKAFLLGSLAGCLAFSVYFATIAPDITWSNFSSDSGDLITASVTLGIAHPPGYPTYLLFGKLFSLLPVGTVAFRFNLFSSLAMAVAAAFSTATAFEILYSSKTTWSASLAAGLALAFSPLVWSQATVAEVYALNLAVLSIFLWSLLTRRSFLLTGFLLGLAITTHLTSCLMLPMCAALVTRGQRGRLASGIVLGLLPLLTLPLLNQLNSPVIWGDPSSLSGWWWLVSASLYHANLSLPASFQALLFHLSEWSAVIFRQFAWLGWLFVIIGIITGKIEKRDMSWLLISAAFYAVFSIVYSTDDAILNFLPALLLLAPLLAAGLGRVGNWSLLLPTLLLLFNFQGQNLRNEHQQRPAVEAILRDIPEDAILITPGDQSIFALWYFQHVEGKRPDIILVDANLLAFSWYRDRLALRYPKLGGLSADDLELFKEFNEKIRPFCEFTIQDPQGVSCQSQTANAQFPIPALAET